MKNLDLNSANFDPWGVDPEFIKKIQKLYRPIYEKYFRVQCSGINKLPEGRCLLVANHGCQLPLDGMLVIMAAMLEGKPARLVRSMVERWAFSLPFVSELFQKTGQVIGDPHHARQLLNTDNTVLVFPEGVKGAGKTIDKAYELQKMGGGFIRLALETKSPIVPVGIVGAEEIYPSIYNFEWLAKKLNMPYFFVTPFFPFLGPLGLIPLPSKVYLSFGDPLHLDLAYPDLHAEASDEEIFSIVDEVKSRLEKEIKKGLDSRNGAGFGMLTK